jgi:hypothetical protein
MLKFSLNDQHFKNGESFLTIARGVHENDQRFYIEKAESAFIKAADDVDHPIYKADAYKFAAICAKAANKNPQTVKTLADLAHQNYISAENRVTSSSIASTINNSDIPAMCKKLTNHEYRSLPRQEYREPVTHQEHRMQGSMALTGSAYDAGCQVM